MELTHQFTVPVPVQEAWDQFQDIATVAQCFPGAQVTSAEGDTFAGSVKVKLGPIALVYNGTGTFTEKDEANHRFVVDAKGKDKRGNGTAGATVTLTMDGSAGSSTDVTVNTDLAITGKPAQFGRGVMQDVSDKLLGQFVSCLEQRLGSEPAVETPRRSSEVETPATSAEATPVVEPVETPPMGAAPPVETTPGPEPVEPRVEPAAKSAVPPPPAPTAESDDALNLGATVLPILAKTYWKQAVAAVVAIGVVIWIIRR